ncbi:unnamed protein product [Echinostoma caproni]|uniref:LRRcap domain-containing protein n=1 Tax=Echinostoma caproni TaxID=27848 RepID=A0A183AV62_9TREM|nr:unnamed protein product [Echinostoma caproni]
MLLQPTLSKLDVSGNRLETLKDLGVLSTLTYLAATNNLITNMKELIGSLQKLKKLKELEISGNPVMSVYKAKETVIVNTMSLEKRPSVPGASVPSFDTSMTDPSTEFIVVKHPVGDEYDIVGTELSVMDDSTQQMKGK